MLAANRKRVHCSVNVNGYETRMGAPVAAKRHDLTRVTTHDSMFAFFNVERATEAAVTSPVGAIVQSTVTVPLASGARGSSLM